MVFIGGYCACSVCELLCLEYITLVIRLGNYLVVITAVDIGRKLKIDLPIIVQVIILS